MTKKRMIRFSMVLIATFIHSELQLATIADASSWPIEVKFQKEVETRSNWGEFWSTLFHNDSANPADFTVHVFDADTSEPISNAKVMLGTKVDSPFRANTATTDANGYAVFSDGFLRSNPAIDVTAFQAGYTIGSLLQTRANRIEIGLKRFPLAEDYGFLEGTVTGYPTGYDWDTLEFGLFLPAFRPESFFNFDPYQVISSYEVEVDLYGKRKIPGNVILPKQNKKYMGFPVKLNKPNYIMPLANGFRAHMSTFASTVSLQKAVPMMQNKDIIGVLNLPITTHVGWGERTTVQGNQTINLPLDHPLEQGAIVTRVDPQGVSNLDVVLISTVDPEGDHGDFITMDVRGIKAAEFDKGTGGSGVTKNLNIIKNRRSSDKFQVFAGMLDIGQFTSDTGTRAIVGAMQQVDPARSLYTRFANFFNPISMKTVSTDHRSYQFTTANNEKTGLTPNLTLFQLVSEKKNLKTHGKLRTVLWSAMIPESVSAINLPNLGLNVLPSPDTALEETFSWEVVALKTADAFSSEDFDSEIAIQNVQHLSTLIKKF